MVTIFFATGNKHKISEASAILKECNVAIEQVFEDYPESRSDSVAEIAQEGALYVANKINAPVIVEDTGFFIEALNLFPGTFAKFVLQKIGYEGILKLMEEEKNRNAYFQSAVGFCSPDTDPIAFMGTCKGTISFEAKGSGGFGYDPIFIPQNYDQTFGELGDKEKNAISHRRGAFMNFLDWVANNGENTKVFVK